ncbi:DUF1176 domain-containing protein [Sphingomonas sanxanigenens]|uniref:DUF1176 domain-containing protein n=1 Tax=Sphingomonas sanxanigenens DSM 19645 = NX02 TaxID=1123269 RepID=W0AAF8_9SPHN|nr:DUF1176 domain-containing protein [Sphingomonas sanxanigenens]AHE54924.1 hypothetical protein NX02_16225 [Sphingomonas sanxanigenens DSM 19645 = NX02]
MRALPVALVAATSLIAPPAAAQDAVPGAVQVFADWAVGCDNVRDCEAQALATEGEEVPAFVTVSRRAGAGGQPTIAIPFAAGRRPIALLVDGKRWPQPLRIEDDQVRFGAVATDLLLPVLLKADRIELMDVQGIVVGRASLTGISAALKYTDEAQGRTGTPTAIVDKGDRPAIEVPRRAMPAPIAIPVATRTAPPDRLSAGSVRTLRETNACEAGPDAAPPEESWFRIDERHTLLLLSCGGGANNRSALPFIVTNGGRKKGLAADYARFDHPTGYTAEHGQTLLPNPEWDKDAGTITSRIVGSPSGDCGSSQRFAWDGEAFRLIEQRAMSTCRGSLQWIRVWTVPTAVPNALTGR